MVKHLYYRLDEIIVGKIQLGTFIIYLSHGKCVTQQSCDIAKMLHGKVAKLQSCHIAMLSLSNVVTQQCCHFAACGASVGKFPLGILHFWEVSTWEIFIWKVALGKMPQRKYLNTDKTLLLVTSNSYFLLATVNPRYMNTQQEFFIMSYSQHIQDIKCRGKRV